MVVDGDHGPARRSIAGLDDRRDAGGGQLVEEEPPGVITAEGTDEGGGGAGAGGSNRLVEALAAGVLGVVGAEHRLARRREARRRGDEIEVGAADDADVVRRRSLVGDQLRRTTGQTARARTPIGAIRR